MRPSRLFAGLSITTLLAAGCESSGVEVPADYVDLQGKKHRPIPGPQGRPTVLFFVMTDCPIANGYAPEIGAIASEFKSQGVRCFVVHVDARATRSELVRHQGEFGLPAPVLVDRDGALIRYCGATRTPEAALLTAGGELQYLGRIDDRYRALGRRRPKPTRRDLRDAIAAVLSGRPVATPSTVAIGCLISDMEGR